MAKRAGFLFCAITLVLSSLFCLRKNVGRSLSLLEQYKRVLNTSILQIDEDNHSNMNRLKATHLRPADKTTAQHPPPQETQIPIQQEQLSDPATQAEEEEEQKQQQQQQQQPQLRKERVVMATYVFGKELANKRRFQMFLKTAATTGFDFAIVGDTEPSFPLPDNVFHFHVTWDQFVDRVLDKLFLENPQERLKLPPPELTNVLRSGIRFKICDYKPLLAYLFPEVVEGYDWWGTIDNDMVLGNLTRFIPQDTLRESDIICGIPYKKSWGPFMLYRNIPKVNELFLKLSPRHVVSSYKSSSSSSALVDVFINDKAYFFDEWGRAWDTPNPEASAPASMSGLIEEYAEPLGLRWNSVPGGQIWDKGMCGDMRENPNANIPDRCGECVYDTTGSTGGQILTMTHNGEEAVLCNYQESKSISHDRSLADSKKFQLLLQAKKFRVNHQEGFDFVVEEQQEPHLRFQQQHQQQRVLMVTFLFGKELANKRRFQMFLKTAATAGFDFAIVGDTKPSFPLPDNVFHFHVTWDQFVDRVLDKLFLENPQERLKLPPPELTNVLRSGGRFKICDYKPLLAYLFPEVVEGYDWWGHVDNDIVLGNLTRFIPQDTLRESDIISGIPSHRSWGPFMLYRNIPKVNELFLKLSPRHVVSSYKLSSSSSALVDIFITDYYYFFDEWGVPWKIPNPEASAPASMSGLIEEYAEPLGLRWNSVPGGQIWDKGMCGSLRKDPIPERCGECVYDTTGNTGAGGGQILTMTHNGEEAVLCNYQESKSISHDRSLADSKKFQLLLQAKKFRVNYQEGFDFVVEEQQEPHLRFQQQHQQQRVLMVTYVFGNEAANKRRLLMFLRTAATSGFDYAIVGDTKPSFPLPDNVYHIHVTWDQLVDRVLEKIFRAHPDQEFPSGKKIMKLRSAGVRKVCDYKPLFAYLFPELVKHYDWWGHIDNDMVVGDLTHFIPQDQLREYDIISGIRWKKSFGPFMLYRNIPLVNELFLNVQHTESSLVDTFITNHYHYFDEWGDVWNLPGHNVAVLPASMSGLIGQYADQLGLKWSSVQNAYPVTDTIACGFRRKDRKAKIPERCAECVYRNPGAATGQGQRQPVLTKTETGQEVFLCHYQESKQTSHDPSLADDAKFEKLLMADTFRVNYQEGFDLVAQ